MEVENMYVFKCNNRNIGMVFEEMDCPNHKIHIRVIPNLDDSHTEFQFQFINGKSFVKLETHGEFEYTPELDDILSTSNISMHPDVRDKNMTAFVLFIQSLRDATKV